MFQALEQWVIFSFSPVTRLINSLLIARPGIPTGLFTITISSFFASIYDCLYAIGASHSFCRNKSGSYLDAIDSKSHMTLHIFPGKHSTCTDRWNCTIIFSFIFPYNFQNTADFCLISRLAVGFWNISSIRPILCQLLLCEIPDGRLLTGLRLLPYLLFCCTFCPTSSG